MANTLTKKKWTKKQMKGSIARDNPRCLWLTRTPIFPRPAGVCNLLLVAEEEQEQEQEEEQEEQEEQEQELLLLLCGSSTRLLCHPQVSSVGFQSEDTERALCY